MNVQRRNDVTINNLSSGPQLPEWLGERARRNLSKRDEQIRRRIELIQDFSMPSSSSKVVQSLDGRYLIVGGTYPPRIRCYDVHDLTMKFERYVNGHIVDICLLGEDYGKMAILQDDRYVAFHAHYGSHESVRIPKFGRGMAYESTTCELLLAASGPEVYRLNLEEGRFTEPWKMEPSSVAASCIAVSPAQPLASVGCEDGVVRFWDNRTPDSLLKPFLSLDVQAATTGLGFADDIHLSHRNPNEITSIGHDPSGLYLGVGTAGGLVALYDVRSSKPLHVKEHKHGMPIHTIKFHPGSGCILSSDEKLVKIWKFKSTGDLVNTSTASDLGLSGGDPFTASIDNGSIGSLVANIEGSGKFTNFVMGGDEKDPMGNKSGLMLCATDQPKLEAFYIPKIGIAPSWCSFLENITEELEERDLKRETGGASGDVLVRDGQETIFENYKFVSRDDLEKLGVSDLIGTPMLKAYMHGFFMDINLYNKVRAVANPFEYEEYRKKKVKERLEAKRASRIAPKALSSKKLTAVNPDLADRLHTKAESNTKSGKAAKGILSDDRFGRLFSNPDYHIDEDDENFKLRNPNGIADISSKRKRREDMDSDDDGDEDDIITNAIGNFEEAGGFRRRSEDEEESSKDSGSDSEDDGFRGGMVRGEAYQQSRELGRKKSKDLRWRKVKKTVMYEADDLDDVNTDALHASLGEDAASKKVQEKIRRMNMPLEKRFQMEEEETPFVRVVKKGGSKEITYIPKDSRKNNETKDDGAKGSKRHGRSEHRRRGIKDLGFKTPFRNR
ncbi:NUC153 domain containing protein [Nitzschia inconspicua]|uniref:NUC153 domain containing protein n=1 Tax=Nitzschia inconspicua TaxID=303405 RepID=A0A9K3PV57_9STRA|nr:NUC153 domain containing protein [Nitzschia inconspicua]